MGWSSKIIGNTMVGIKRTNYFFGPVKIIVFFCDLCKHKTFYNGGRSGRQSWNDSFMVRILKSLPSMKKLRPFLDTSIGSIAAPRKEPTRTNFAVSISSTGDRDFSRSVRAIPSCIMQQNTCISK